MYDLFMDAYMRGANTTSGGTEMKDEAWVVLEYSTYEPVRVHGLFESEDEARWYVNKQGLETYDVQMMRDAWDQG
jgi:hypothetical protein